MGKIIKIEHLSKKYKLGEWQKYYTLRDALTGLIKSPLKLFQKKGEELSKGEFWALENITLDVNEGEAVGIIGPNGAGKSTLLKILSRITPPTKGSAVLGGRVGSLLEVGTGFHQELTGRENIYLNGAILGMKRNEISKKFDEIVEFSGVGRFLDTPMKHYSTGMYMRLAFAVAAHLDPEILIVDEVLSVGDAEFQEKCLQKMNSISKTDKRTVIFVSHNMDAVQKLCDRAILINQGKIVKDGKVSSVINTYMKQIQTVAESSLSKRTDRDGTGQIKVKKISFKDKNGLLVHSLTCGTDGVIELEFDFLDNDVKKFNLVLNVVSFADQTPIVQMGTEVLKKQIKVGQSPVSFRLHNVPLLPDKYQLNILVNGEEGELYDMLVPAQIFNVDYGDYYHTGTLPDKKRGRLLVEYDIH